MQSLLDFAWLIPFLPFVASLLIAILLLSFNRTMNRLTKPVSFLIALSTAISTLLGLLFFEKHLSGDVPIFNLEKYGFKFYIDDSSSVTIVATGAIIFSLLILSYFRSQRQKGYVAYVVSIGLLAGTLFTFALSGDFFHSLIKLSA